MLQHLLAEFGILAIMETSCGRDPCPAQQLVFVCSTSIPLFISCFFLLHAGLWAKYTCIGTRISTILYAYRLHIKVDLSPAFARLETWDIMQGPML